MLLSGSFKVELTLKVHGRCCLEDQGMSCHLFASMCVSVAEVMLLTRQRRATSCEQRSRATQRPSMRAFLNKHASEAQRRSMPTMPTAHLSLSLALVLKHGKDANSAIVNTSHVYEPCLRTGAHSEPCHLQPSQSAEGSMACPTLTKPSQGCRGKA